MKKEIIFDKKRIQEVLTDIAFGYGGEKSGEETRAEDDNGDSETTRSKHIVRRLNDASAIVDLIGDYGFSDYGGERGIIWEWDWNGERALTRR